MTVTVDWGNLIVHVARSEMLLIQSNPVEIRQLDLTDFRYALHDVQDNELGVVMDRIHSHNPAVTVAGVTLAQVVEIINNYTVTFEDGLYNVNIVGGNSNVADRVNKNQVGVNTANSAGLQDSASLQSSSFANVVAVDTTYGTAGTTFPIGTKGTPSSNIPDAITIAGIQNLDTLFIIGNITLDTGDIVDGLNIKGQSPIATMITVNTGCSCIGTGFQDAYLTGTIDGGSIITRCLIDGLNNMSGFLDECSFQANTIVLGGATTMVNCFSNVAGSGTPYLDFGGTGNTLAVRGYIGGLGLKNKTGTDAVSIDMTSGQVRFDADVSVTDNIYVRGKGRLVDNSTGTALIDSVGLLTGESTVRGSGFVSVTSTGSAGTTAPIGTTDFPVNNVADAILIAQANHISEIHINDTITTAGTEDLSAFHVFGDSPVVSQLIVTAGTTTTNATFRNLNISGTLSSDGAIVERCQIGNLAGMQNYIYQCFLYGTVTLSGNTTAAFCAIAPTAVAQKAYFSFGGLASTLIISDWGAGIAVFDNMITGSFAGASGTGGRVELGINNTGGNVVYGGNLIVNPLNLGTVDDIKDSSVAEAVWIKALP